MKIIIVRDRRQCLRRRRELALLTEPAAQRWPPILGLGVLAAGILCALLLSAPVAHACWPQACAHDWTSYPLTTWAATLGVACGAALLAVAPVLMILCLWRLVWRLREYLLTASLGLALLIAPRPGLADGLDTTVYTSGLPQDVPAFEIPLTSPTGDGRRYRDISISNIFEIDPAQPRQLTDLNVSVNWLSGAGLSLVTNGSETQLEVGDQIGPIAANGAAVTVRLWLDPDTADECPTESADMYCGGLLLVTDMNRALGETSLVTGSYIFRWDLASPQYVIPGPPTDVIATPGDGTATLSFVPPSDTGGAATLDYRVTCYPGVHFSEGPGSPLIVTGLTNGVTYSCGLQAHNDAGYSTPVIREVTPFAAPVVTIPGIPQNVTALAGDTIATLSFTPPTDTGGNELIMYSGTCYTGGHDASRSVSPLVITHLINTITYNCGVRACNSAGCSAYVNRSVTPLAPVPAGIPTSLTLRRMGGQAAAWGYEFRPAPLLGIAPCVEGEQAHAEGALFTCIPGGRWVRELLSPFP